MNTILEQTEKTDISFGDKLRQTREALNLSLEDAAKAISLRPSILEQLENYKNEAIDFEQQRVINQVRQRVLQQALQGALGTLNSCLNNELHLRTVSANIGMFGMMK